MQFTLATVVGLAATAMAVVLPRALEGDFTYFNPAVGACGFSNSDGDFIVAISAALYDAAGTGDPNKNPLCGRSIVARHGGKEVRVTVADRCVGCATYDLDLSVAAYNAIADPNAGRVKGSWDWV
ncbi:hypothetical protein RB595_000156 [Gaeumannomyces hyphopodioides]